jgi:16S rRNA (cytidine1402-2'-O)-methyltransferase
MPKLYIVPTPIGNLQDITLRALNVLKNCEIIICEDTRVTQKLLQHYEIKAQLISNHNFNEHKNLEKIITKILEGKNMALVSDAGTPGISDPGYLLIRACINHLIEIECLPGAVAFIPALINSGLPCDRFCFEGFLPHKKGRQKRLQELCNDNRTLIFYESPYRLIKLLNEIEEYFGSERKISVSRELTKKFEETIRGTVAEVKIHFANNEPIGEFVIIVQGKSK